MAFDAPASNDPAASASLCKPARRHAGKTAFVFSGGGSCGAAQVGMLRELVRFGLSPDFVVGTSVGAINGAFFASQPTAEGIGRMEALWRGIRRQDVFPFSLRSLMRLLRHHVSLVDPSAVRGLLERNFERRRLEDASLPVHVIATDVQDGSAVRLCRGPVVDALLASIAIPAVLPPVLVGGRLLMDGGVASNTPVRIAIELGATRIIVLPTTPCCTVRSEPPRSAVDLALHAFNLLMAGQRQRQLQDAPTGVQIAFAPAPAVQQNNPFEFSRTDEMIDAAAGLTREWLLCGGLWGRAGMPNVPMAANSKTALAA